MITVGKINSKIHLNVLLAIILTRVNTAILKAFVDRILYLTPPHSPSGQSST